MTRSGMLKYVTSGLEAIDLVDMTDVIISFIRRKCSMDMELWQQAI